MSAIANGFGGLSGRGCAGLRSGPAERFVRQVPEPVSSWQTRRDEEDLSLSARANILLIGPRACGKSTVGRLLGNGRADRFIDLDDIVKASFSEQSVAEIWRVHGEERWRDAEVRELSALLADSSGPVVIALGGGTPMIAEARDCILAARKRGEAVTVYLRCAAEILCERLRKDTGDRPSLTGADPADEAAEVLDRRAAIYEEVADIVLDCGEDDAETLVRRILLQLA